MTVAYSIGNSGTKSVVRRLGEICSPNPTTSKISGICEPAHFQESPTDPMRSFKTLKSNSNGTGDPLAAPKPNRPELKWGRSATSPSPKSENQLDQAVPIPGRTEVYADSVNTRILVKQEGVH